MNNGIAYYRVSTERQRRSGLGIEAQRAAVHRFAEAEEIACAIVFLASERASYICGSILNVDGGQLKTI